MKAGIFLKIIIFSSLHQKCIHANLEMCILFINTENALFIIEEPTRILNKIVKVILGKQQNILHDAVNMFLTILSRYMDSLHI